MNSTVMMIGLAGVLIYFAGKATVDGAKWIGHEAKKGGTAVVHALKKIPHPHHQAKP